MNLKNLKNVCILLVMALSLAACDKKKAETKGEPAKQEQKVEAAPAADEKGADEGGDEVDGLPTPFIATGDVAVVNGKPIPAARFMEQTRPLAQIAQQFPADRLGQIKNQIVERLIDDELIRQRLADRLDKVNEEAIAAEKQKFMGQFPSKEAFESTMKKMGMSEKVLEEQLKLSAALKQLLEDEYNAKVTDEEVQKYYDEHKLDLFTHKPEVHARHILLKLADNAPAAEVKKVLQKAKKIEKEAKAKGADFAKLAEKYSEGPTKSSGGDLGFFDAGKMVPEFSKAAFALKPGEVSEPVRTQFGYHIIKVEEAKPAWGDSFDSVKDGLRERLEMQKLGQQLQALLEELKKQATIEHKEGDNIKVNPKFEEASKAAAQNQGLPPGLPIGGPAGAPPAGGAGDLKLQLNNK